MYTIPYVALRDGPYPLLLTLAYCPARPSPSGAFRTVGAPFPPETARCVGAGIPEPVVNDVHVWEKGDDSPLPLVAPPLPGGAPRPRTAPLVADVDAAAASFARAASA